MSFVEIDPRPRQSVRIAWEPPPLPVLNPFQRFLNRLDSDARYALIVAALIVAATVGIFALVPLPIAP